MILLENSIASAILTKFRELNDFSGSDDEESEKSPDGSVDEESSELQTENGKTGQGSADSTTLEDSDRQSNETLVAGNEESPTSEYKTWTRRYKGNLVEESKDEQNCAVILEKVALICVI
uniref:Uncharacterized protein n=1 Tax=Panagrolaimus sp. JU765 TaxID=591449 RepID=A0AC34RN38_9BILA